MRHKLPFHSLLIFGATSSDRELAAGQAVKELSDSKTTKKGGETRNSDQDRLTIKPEGRSIGIEQTRGLKIWTKLKPSVEPFKIAFIHNAECLTIEAQNSLLKILEEPPEATLIILTCANPQNLLPTVVSRCFLKEIRGGPSQPALSFTEELSIVKILELDFKDRLELTEKFSKIFSDREKLLPLFDQWLTEFRLKIVSTDPIDRAGIKTLLETLDQIIILRRVIAETNATPRLAVEAFLARYSIPEKRPNPA